MTTCAPLHRIVSASAEELRDARPATLDSPLLMHDPTAATETGELSDRFRNEVETKKGKHP